MSPGWNSAAVATNTWFAHFDALTVSSLASLRVTVAVDDMANGRAGVIVMCGHAMSVIRASCSPVPLIVT